MSAKGISYTTGTVHYVRTVGHRDRSVSNPMLVQRCGMGGRQLSYLAPAPDDAEVTCKRCVNAEAKRA